ncbi:spermidine synthase [Kitasatospora sp. NPDC092948]|uniref:spermidine synthase n=1 Tax=Kitasatospora sp. NPDC092948 TaxID=3364088 RepID=UPI003816239D
MSVLPSRQNLPEAEVIDRREGPYGEVVLRRRGEQYEIIANGCFLMDTADGRSERLLIRAALDELAVDGLALDGAADGVAGRAADGVAAGRAVGESAGGASVGGGPAGGVSVGGGPSVLIGGLGVGFSLACAAAEPRWGRIAVAEREGAIIDWHRTGPLGAFSAGALDDPRVEVLHTDLVAYLASAAERYDALCLDIDNGPDWTVTEENDALYGPTGLANAAARLRPGGVLAVWSAQPSTAFEQALRDAGFTDVRTEEIAVERGVPDVVHLARRAG